MTPNGITTANGPLWNDKEQISEGGWEVPETPISLELVALQTYVNKHKEQEAQKEEDGLVFVRQQVEHLEDRLTKELPSDFADLFTFTIPLEETELYYKFRKEFGETEDKAVLWNSLLRESGVRVPVKLISKAIPTLELRVQAVLYHDSLKLLDTYTTSFDVQFPKADYHCIFNSKENINRLPHFVAREYDKRFNKL